MSDNKPTVTQRHAVFVNNHGHIEDRFSDITTVKEKIKLSDGRTVRHFYWKENVQRPFYVEKRENQTYKDKKETRPLSELNEYWCTQSELAGAVARATGWRGAFIPGVRKLAQSPYLYGTDMTVEVYVKRMLDAKYEKEYGEGAPILDMAVLDYETDMMSPLGEITMGSVTMKDQWYCAVDRNWLKRYATDDEETIWEALELYLGDIARERGANIRECLTIVDSEIDVCRHLFEKLHEIKPDVCSIWNVTFDINKTFEACERAGVDPADLFCDPSIPEEYRTVVWRPDEGNKQKADGTSSTKDIADKWHWLNAPASFNFIDNMCMYRTLRAVEQKMPGGYSLDNILNHVFKGKVRKMKFKEANHLVSGSPEWHRFMQTKHPLAYIAYNIFDCVVMELLDEKERDISHKLYSYAGISHWSRIKSNPTRLCDAYYFFLRDNEKRMLCSTSNKMRHEFDSITLPKTGWIVTLDMTRCRVKKMGRNPFEHDEHGKPKYLLDTKVVLHAYDSDVSSSYPSNELAMNVGRDTTQVEVCQMEGRTLEELRSITVNLMNGNGNGARISRDALGLPGHDELLRGFLKDYNEESDCEGIRMQDEGVSVRDAAIANGANAARNMSFDYNRITH